MTKCLSKSASASSTASGYEPHTKKQKLMLSDANRAEQYIQASQPGRVPLKQISWYHDNRGGQGVMQYHAQDVAVDIAENGTSKRRYNAVRLVRVPDTAVAKWLAGNKKKASRTTTGRQLN